VGLLFNGTALPLLIGVAVYGSLAMGLSLQLKARA
jgi:hypothetical protein